MAKVVNVCDLCAVMFFFAQSEMCVCVYECEQDDGKGVRQELGTDGMLGREWWVQRVKMRLLGHAVMDTGA